MIVVLLVCVERSEWVGGGGCWEEPKHVEDFKKVGLKRCYLCINKTGATGDNVVTAEDSRERGHEHTIWKQLRILEKESSTTGQQHK